MPNITPETENDTFTLTRKELWAYIDVHATASVYSNAVERCLARVLEELSQPNPSLDRIKWNVEWAVESNTKVKTAAEKARE